MKPKGFLEPAMGKKVIIKMSMNPMSAGLFVFVLISMAIGQAPVWKGTNVKDGEVVVVRNPKEPINNKPILSLKEDFSIGGSQAKNEYVLALPTSLAVDKKGELFVLDFKESRIKVFDDAGKFVRTIGRLGQGPGEIGAAWSISLPWGSNELAFRDIRNRKLTFFSRKGRFSEAFRSEG